MKRVMHVMFSKQMGGMEQSFLDYTHALHNLECEVYTLTHEQFPQNKELEPFTTKRRQLAPHGYYDFFTWLKAKKLLKELAPDIIIAHGNRAIALMQRIRGKIPLIAVNHSYNMRRSVGADALVTVNHDMEMKALSLGQPIGKIHMIPNVVDCKNAPQHFIAKPYGGTPTIGVLGRFTFEKGYDIFISAMAELKKQKIPCRAIIGGDGKEATHLKQQAAKLGLTNKDLVFAGWTTDKAAFFEKIDIFCIPSRYETFGMVLLEAWSFGKPIVATDSEGPKELINDGYNGILVKRDNIPALTKGLADALRDMPKMHKLAENGFTKAHTEFTLHKLSFRLKEVMRYVTS